MDRVIHKQYPEAAGSYKKSPFDLYCPSIQEKLKKGICPKCGHYWPSAAAMKRHSKCHKEPGQVAESEVTDEIEVEEMEVTARSTILDEEPMPVISNWIDHLASPFEQSVMDEVF